MLRVLKKSSLFEFLFVLTFVCVSEAALMCSMSGAQWSAFLPLLLIVTPALLVGVDLWHYISDRLPEQKESSEFVWVARFVSCWLIVSVPATVVLIALYWCMPQMFSQIHSGADAWRVSMSIYVWHGFISWPLLAARQRAFSVAHFATWLKELRQTPITR
jgi:hypothetical protein